MEEEDIDEEHEELERRDVMNCGGQWGVAKTTASCEPEPEPEPECTVHPTQLYRIG